MKQLFLACSMLIIGTGLVQAQNAADPAFTTIGKELPDYAFNDISNYSKKRTTLLEQRGKWLILDFWSLGCSSCVASMPKMSMLQTQYADKAQIMMVGYNSKTSDKHIRQLYDRLKEKHGLVMPSAWDTTLLDKVDCRGVPYIMIIDPQGVLRSVVRSVSETDMAALVNEGKVPESTLTQEKAMRSFDLEKPLADHFSQDGRFEVLYGGVLMPWNKLTYLTERMEKDRFECTGMSVARLYNLAFFGQPDWSIIDAYPAGNHPYYGKVYAEPVFEVADRNALIEDFKTGDNMYNYFLKVKQRDGESDEDYKKRRMDMMKQDLNNAFNYTAAIETRKMPCYVLTVNPDKLKKLLNKGAKRSFDSKPYIGFKATDLPMNFLMNHIPYQGPMPVYNETGITGNIDVEMDFLGNDLQSFIIALEKNGIYMKQEMREMQVLVVRDRK